MEIVEIIDPRYLFTYSSHHLSGCKNYFYISATIGLGTHKHGFLVWPGGEITVRHAFSNKRLRRLKTKEVALEKDMCRCIVGSFYGGISNLMILREDADDFWTLCYNPTIDVKIIDEIMWILHRLKP